MHQCLNCPIEQTCTAARSHSRLCSYTYEQSFLGHLVIISNLCLAYCLTKRRVASRAFSLHQTCNTAIYMYAFTYERLEHTDFVSGHYIRQPSLLEDCTMHILASKAFSSTATVEVRDQCDLKIPHANLALRMSDGAPSCQAKDDQHLKRISSVTTDTSK